MASSTHVNVEKSISFNILSTRDKEYVNALSHNSGIVPCCESGLSIPVLVTDLSVYNRIDDGPCSHASHKGWKQKVVD